ncbi:hypothetical protein HGA34_03405 [Candidatus Falkowbacteria bacterium]|nr:hypothetical protein [Candidatus Falkowbacteria bacterium]
MTRRILKNLHHIGMISVILGLIMANFFHAFLMNIDPALATDDIHGACHAHENAGAEKKNGAQKDILPCCADKKSSDAAPLLAVFEFNKSLYLFSLYFSQVPLADKETLKPKSFQAPPNQVALDTIILRI